MRIVLDTNLIVSALMNADGAPAELLDQWNDDSYELVTSSEQFAEFTRVLGYPRVAKYMKPGVVDRFLDRVALAAIMVGDLPKIDLSSDPDDNLILATAIVGQVDFLASGDTKHVLPLVEVEGIPIVTVRQALEILDRHRAGG